MLVDYSLNTLKLFNTFAQVLLQCVIVWISYCIILVNSCLVSSLPVSSRQSLELSKISGNVKMSSPRIKCTRMVNENKDGLLIYFLH